MGELKHIEILEERGVRGWNRWRRENPRIVPNLQNDSFNKADLHGINLRGAFLKGVQFHCASLENADFREAELRGADLRHASMFEAKCQRASFQKARLDHAYLANCKLHKAIMTRAELKMADLREARLRGTDLEHATLKGANLTDAILDGATLCNASLENAILVRTSLRGTDLRGADVYGASVWDIKTSKGTKQEGLKTDSVYPSQVRDASSGVKVNNLNVAHFIALIHRTEIISDLIDASENKVVLLLGRFSRRGKAVLDALADELRKKRLLPIVFDFPPPGQRDTTETVKVLASLSRFVVADLTQPKSAPLELHAIVPHLMVPVVPIIKYGDKTFSMFADLQRKYYWVLRPVEYRTRKELLENVEKGIIRRANNKRGQIRRMKKIAITKPKRITRV
ncbi:MAG: pentapeptide repeat-containing protein [Planctomycetota bacterium]|jgi:uncharacterized protein YjbI with pentapeptide repeats